MKDLGTVFAFLRTMVAISTFDHWTSHFHEMSFESFGFAIPHRALSGDIHSDTPFVREQFFQSQVVG
jgi:hypothetical protein